MILTLIVVGGIRGPLEDAVADYERRIGHYFKFQVIEVAAGSKGRVDAAQVMAAEGERILQRAPAGIPIVAVTREGKVMDSRRLSHWLQEEAVRGSRGVTFVIGGAHGIDGSVLARAERQLSLSAMTFPHEMARLMLVEQLYRAGTISRGEPYHKGP